MNNPDSELLFSVIIPAYNAEHFVCDALDSVAKQTLGHYEIIVVNDGSTDRTSARINQWAASHPEKKLHLIQQKNKGIGSARNAGLDSATGKYVAFLDADDIWHDHKLFLVSEYLKNYPEVDFVCHDEMCFQQKTNKGRLSYGPHKTYKELLFKGNCISTSASVVRRSKILEAGLFSEDLHFNGVEDYELWLRLSKICSIEYLHEVLGEYHIHGSGITNDIPKHANNSLNVINHHYRSWPRKDFFHNWLINRRRADILRSAGRSYMRKNDFSSARTYLCDALSEYPISLKNSIALICCYLRIRT